MIKNLTESVVDGQSLTTRPAPSKLSFHKNKRQSTALQETKAAPAIPSDQEKFSLPNGNLTEKQVELLIKDKTGWPKFSRVFMTSALKDDGLAEVKVIFIISVIFKFTDSLYFC